jgi:GAF domain-containing protein
MKHSNNRVFIFLNDKEEASKASEILKKKYPTEKNNLIEPVSKFADAQKVLTKYYQNGVLFDIFMLDLKLPINTREQFIGIVNQYQAEYECVLVTNGCQLEKEDKSFIDETNAFLIPFISQSSMYPLFENMIGKKFKEKEFRLLKAIGIAIMTSISEKLLTEIVNITLKHLGLKICSVTLVDYNEKKLKIGAITGMGEYEAEFRKNFNIPLTDKAVITECINRGAPIQYENILDDRCPFKYKEFAKKMGLKSILVIPIYDRRGRGNKRILATLNVYTRFSHKFQDDELELANKIADKTTAALLQKGMLEKEKKEREGELKFIERVTAELNRHVSDYKKVFETIVEEGIELVMADQGCIKLCRKDKTIDDCISKCENDPCDPEKCRDSEITNYVMTQKKSLIIGDINDSPFRDPNIKETAPCSRISVPLMLQSEAIGILTAEQNQKNYFTDHHRRLFEALARHAVIAIENTKRYNEMQKRLHAQDIIKTLIVETSRLEAIEDKEERKKYREDQLDEIIKYAIEETGKILDAQSGFVALAEFTSKYAVRNKKWQFGLKEGMTPNLEIGVVKNGKVVFERNRCIVGKVIAEGKLRNCKNVEDDEYYLKKCENDITMSQIVVPLKFQEQTFGAFSLDSIHKSHFSKEDEEILESIATQMALLIKRFRYLNKLVDLNKPFKNIDNLDRLYDEIRDRTLDTLDTNVCYLRVVERNEFVIKSFKGIRDFHIVQSLKPGKGISGRVAENLEPQIIKNVQEEFDPEYIPFAIENNLFAMMAVPVISSRPDGTPELIGVLNTYANRICDFTSLDLQLMLAIGEKAGEAIKKARLINQLDAIAKVDRILTTTSEKVILQNIADAAKNLLDAHQVVLYRYNSNIYENFGFPTPATTSGEFSDRDFKLQENFNENSFIVLLLKEKQDDFFIESFEDDELIEKFRKNSPDSESLSKFYEREQLESAIILKLKFKKEIVGILFINYRYKMYFSPEVKRIAETFANTIAIAVSNIRKYEEIERLHDIGNTIVSKVGIENVLKSVAVNSFVTLMSDLVILYKYDNFKKKLIYPPNLYGNIYFPEVLLGQDEENDALYSVIKGGKDIFASDVKKNKIFGSKQIPGSKPITNQRFVDREKIKSCAAILLKVRHGIVGLMFINYRTKQKFHGDQKKAIKIFANQAAIAIRNANLFREGNNTIKRIVRNLNSIKESGYEIVKNLNKDQVTEHDILQPIMDKALELIDVDMGYIGIPVRKPKSTKIVVCSDKYEKLRDNSVKYYYPEQSEWVKNQEKYDIYPDKNKKGDYTRFADEPEYLYGFPDVVFTDDKNVHSALRVPIYSDKDFLGIIVLESEKEKAFTINDAYAVMSLANQASLALQNYKLIDQLRKLSEIDIAILKGHNDLNYVLEIILQAALDLVKKNHGEISFLVDEETLRIEKSIPEKVRTNILKVHESISGIAVLEKKTHYEPDINISKSKKFVQTKRINTRSELVVPLLVDENLIGVLNIESDEPNDFPEGDIKVLEMLSRQAAIAIYLAQQKKKLIEKEKEASIGTITRESVHWVGNKIGPIKQRVEDIQKNLVKHSQLLDSNHAFSLDLEKDLELIYEAAESALAIKSDLIDPGRNKVNFDLIKLLKNCIEKVKNEYDSVDIITHFEVNAFSYYWDRSHIERVFHYILKNAVQAIEDKIKTTPDGGEKKFAGRIEVRILRKDGSFLIIEFEDNGCGIQEKDMSELYRPFFTTKGAYRGSGVGLYFCRRTMIDLGGKIYVKSTEPGVGTTFCLEFPFQDEE